MSSSSSITDAELHAFDPVNFEAPKPTYPLVTVFEAPQVFSDKKYREIRVWFAADRFQDFFIHCEVFAARQPYILADIKSIELKGLSLVSKEDEVKNVIKRHTRDYLEACR